MSYVWLVDPAAQTLETFGLREGRWLLIGALKDDDRVAVRCGGVFAGGFVGGAGRNNQGCRATGRVSAAPPLG